MSVEDKIRVIAENYSNRLKQKINDRTIEMEGDDTSHFLIYQVLGISDEEGRLIDLYQNKGRFLYRYAGSFLEDAAKICLKEKFPAGESCRIPNTRGQRPKTFEVDWLNGTTAIEIKWRDATTDGDHITKEHTRILTIADAGFIPIRVMFYYPVREQAMKIQRTLQTLYKGVGGEYYFGESAWEYIHTQTGVNLLEILQKLANENVKRSSV